MGEPRLHPIAPDELPDLLTRLDDGQTTDLALIGPDIWLPASPDHWPKELQGRVLYRLTGELSGLPRELLRLDRLQTLTLWRLDLRDEDAVAIAEYLGQLTSLNLASDLLSSTKVGDAGAQAIAENLGQLTSLSLLSNQVGDAGARAIAEHLGQLTSLDLCNNQVGDAGARAIAEHLGQLTWLNLWGNHVGKAGARAIAEHLGQLTSLNLRFNHVGDAGARAIAEYLRRLTSLNLDFNQVGDAGARAIAEHLRQLTSLNLDDNQVGKAGAWAIAEYLGQLTSLDLNNNQVGYAGARAIAEHLGQLTSLDLSGNKVGDAGALVIAEYLHQLTSLALWGNKVGEAGARAVAEHLGQLTSLNLGYNKVGDEGVAAIGQQLTGLVTLELQENKRVTTVAPLEHLPLSRLNIANTGVADLSPLKSLVLAGLPVKWRLDSGPGIYVEGCPLTHPSPEIVQEGPEAVLNYFREIEAQGVDRLFEAKLLILGEGGSGKTSLLRRMFLPEMDLPTEDETTRGIHIHRHEFQMSIGRSQDADQPKTSPADDSRFRIGTWLRRLSRPAHSPVPDGGRTFRLNSWDFGGQQIYHATHQFFLTRRSLYVLVDDTRSDHKSIHDEGFKFWLEVVETLSERSPLLIFQNEKGGRSKPIDEAGIKGRFPNVKDVYRGNLEHPGAADGLRQAVEYFAQRLPHIGEDVPAQWVAIRKDLEDLARTKPYIPLDQYFTVYGRHLSLDRKGDHDKALHLSQYLHDLGVFLHFQHPPELRRTVFLQNQWVTEAVFRILDDEDVKSQRGRFTLADCDRLWSDRLGSDRGYADKDVELRALMVRFELCYRLPDTDQETWLVPQHLSPSKPPALSDWARPGDLVLTYRYEFLPKGLVSRLIVRMHRFVKQPDLCWSRGALFEYGGFEHGETQVLVETTARGNEIALRSRGPEQKALLSIIASDLDALNNGFRGLKDKVGKWVPCICDTCARTTTPEFFAHKGLLKRKRDHKLTIECPESYADVSVLELLDGLKLERLPEWAQEPANFDEPFAIAVSFPGEDRPFVLKIVEHLAKALGRDRVFYDEWYEARLLGSGGDLKLQDFYERAELVIPFFSEHYTKPWCSLEWETIRGILLNRREDDAVIPVHLDDTEIPGWSAVSFGIKPKGRSTEEIAHLILEAYRLRDARTGR
ncbi:COR domain-containing protein [Candidatus Thiosymbion oneisti]|uniref:COR domain-containing protein n=1 Tax=Candidatus Thiosymbion oneisti TaxID=589554 RepID=UPI000A59FB50|nr:COR domain-containing protein [Candidatus Thiosymbion oneisti]